MKVIRSKLTIRTLLHLHGNLLLKACIPRTKACVPPNAMHRGHVLRNRWMFCLSLYSATTIMSGNILVPLYNYTRQVKLMKLEYPALLCVSCLPCLLLWFWCPPTLSLMIPSSVCHIITNLFLFLFLQGAINSISIYLYEYFVFNLF